MNQEALRDSEAFRSHTLPKVAVLNRAEKAITDELHKALEPRPPLGTEMRLVELLQASSTPQTDLRELIIRLLNEGQEDVDLAALMQDLRGLFQKNQIAIFIERARA